MWHKASEKPPNIPEDNDFGVDYEIQYMKPDGRIETMETEWLWEKAWNCCYPVIAWREINKIIPFPVKENSMSEEIDHD